MKFLLFVGYPRSGHSIVGACLDAHPNCIISSELDVLKLVMEGATHKRLYQAIFNNSVTSSSKRMSDQYNFTIPGQGKYTELEVIGDKKGGRTAWVLRDHPQMLEHLANIVAPDELVLMHVVRNPFDNIARMSLRDEKPLRISAEEYFRRCEAISWLKTVPPVMLEMAQEELLEQPEVELRKLCEGLGIAEDEDWLRLCADIIWIEPHRSRFDVRWTHGVYDYVRHRMEGYPWLGGYRYFETWSAGKGWHN